MCVWILIFTYLKLQIIWNTISTFICTYYWCLNINNLYIYMQIQKNIHIYIYISMCEYYINIFRILSLSLYLHGFYSMSCWKSSPHTTKNEPKWKHDWLASAGIGIHPNARLLIRILIHHPPKGGMLHNTQKHPNSWALILPGFQLTNPINHHGNLRSPKATPPNK